MKKLLLLLFCFGLSACGQLDSPLPLPLNTTGAHLLVPNFGADSLALLRVDSQSGATSPLGTLSVPGHPKLVVGSADRRFLYVPTQERGIYGFSVDSTGETVQPLAGSPFANTQGTFGLALHPGGRFLVGTGGKRIATFAIEGDGQLSRLSTLELTTDKDLAFNPPVLARQGRFAYVAGGDRGVYGAAVDAQSGALTALPLADFGDVRVLAVHPQGELLCLPEFRRRSLGSWLVGPDGGLTRSHETALDFDPLGGTFASDNFFYLGSDGGRGIFGFRLSGVDGELVPLNPAGGFPAGSRDNNFLITDRGARLLFVSARATGQIFVFRIDSDGRLTAAENSPAGGFSEPDWPTLLD